MAVTARMAGDQDVAALVPEAAFFAAPRNPGDRIGLTWDETQLHRLTS